MWRQLSCLVAFAAILCAPSTGLADLTPVLGSAEDFAVLGGSGITVAGAVNSTTITGDIGTFPTLSITGLGNVVLNGVNHAGDAVTQQAKVDAGTAYTGLANMPFLPANDFTATPTLGGRTLTSGVYHFNAAADLTGTLTLDAQHKNNAFWVFQIGSTLTTASSSLVDVINLGTNDGRDDGLFWQVGSSATLGTTTAFEGNILALTSITMNTDATILNGRALARNGAVTLDDNVISIICPNGGPGYSGGLGFDASNHLVPIDATVVPLPGAVLLACAGMGSALAFGRRFFSVS
jgi:hypothetical protein